MCSTPPQFGILVIFKLILVSTSMSEKSALESCPRRFYLYYMRGIVGLKIPFILA